MKNHFQPVSKIFFWEFIQNFPLLFGFTLAVDQANDHHWLIMGLVAAFGSVLGALTIWYTEPFIVPGEREPFKVTWTNMVVFFFVAILMALYFAQNWGNLLVDALLGTSIGIGVGYGQDLANGKKKPGSRHIVALVLAFTFAIISTRLVTFRFSVFAASLILNAFVSLIIVLVDYLKSRDN